MADIANKQMGKSWEKVLTGVAKIVSSTLELKYKSSHVVADTLDKDLCSICLLKPGKTDLH
jgi:hypothetical protein